MKVNTEKNATMCYLIAKKHDQPGCIAVQAERGKKLASLVSFLGLEMFDKGVQILTVSEKDVYGEYKPYYMVDSLKAFIDKVMDM